MSIVNTNPKNDALLVLQIMVNSSGDTQFSKEWITGKITEVAKHKDPHKLLNGSDYARYLQVKDSTKYSPLQ